MNILYYYWYENTYDDMIETFTQLGHRVNHVSGEIPDYFDYPEMTSLLDQILVKNNYDFIFSFNYIPFLSDVANIHQIPYVSWVYDCPHWTLYAKNISNNCNYIFLFDKDMVNQVIQNGAKHVWHLPLAVNTSRLNKQLQLSKVSHPVNYDTDVSFVGNLYENNPFSQIQFLPEHLRGYLDGCIASQKQLWGINLINKLLNTETLSELEKYIKIPSNENCMIPFQTLFEDMILTKITSDERIQYLNYLKDDGIDVTLFSNSNPQLCPKISFKGTITYMDQMPAVFYRSKININISLRSITSGIPLRAIDIMGAKGFLLSNFQPELAEYFEPEKDFIYFEDLNDFKEKTNYYLKHEIERHAIATSGWEKVQESFSYSKQVQFILAQQL